MQNASMGGQTSLPRMYRAVTLGSGDELAKRIVERCTVGMIGVAIVGGRGDGDGRAQQMAASKGTAVGVKPSGQGHTNQKESRVY